MNGVAVKINVLIYGAGEAGIQIADYFTKSDAYELIGFIDDNLALQGKSFKGIEVHSPNNIPELIEKYVVSEIFIAIPSVRRERYQEILRNLSVHHIHLRTLPKLEKISNGKIKFEDVKEIKIEDLLLRDPVEPKSELLARNINNKVILITGAGGSIGSELCRQIMLLSPKQIVLLDHSEYSLYKISAELSLMLNAAHFSKIVISRVLGSICNESYIHSIVRQFQPDTIYHAAAYKHVALVEGNVSAAVQNNILGTLYLSEAAYKLGVKNFTLISTDKAVRPSSAMGMTKRVSEMILQSFASLPFMQNNPHGTCFSIVRFGNVLGSSGSVVPLFREQIKSGGPVTVTHEDVSRYFMTISEAAQLVIQASSLASGGDIFLLDMGEPIKILDLAKNMIELAGKSLKTPQCPSGDIEIVISGLMKGEKLFEEMLISGVAIKTMHPKIFMADEDFIAWDVLEDRLHNISSSLHNDKRMYEQLASLVPIYK